MLIGQGHHTARFIRVPVRRRPLTREDRYLVMAIAVALAAVLSLLAVMAIVGASLDDGR